MTHWWLMMPASPLATYPTDTTASDTVFHGIAVFYFMQKYRNFKKKCFIPDQ